MAGILSTVDGVDNVRHQVTKIEAGMNDADDYAPDDKGWLKSWAIFCFIRYFN